jgi:hypothetical protein
MFKEQRANVDVEIAMRKLPLKAAQPLNLSPRRRDHHGHHRRRPQGHEPSSTALSVPYLSSKGGPCTLPLRPRTFPTHAGHALYRPRNRYLMKASVACSEDWADSAMWLKIPLSESRYLRACGRIAGCPAPPPRNRTPEASGARGANTDQNCSREGHKL